MPEDGIIGFTWFETENGVNIANQAAVDAASKHLVNETAYEAAIDSLRASSAFEAVNDAAERKASRFDDRPVHDAPDDDLGQVTGSLDFGWDLG
jgi:hypothetical protein